MAASPIVQAIIQGARARGLDPNAVLAVARQEGLGGGIGDNGTSFGPFQLHYGGAYSGTAPRGAQASQTWASSPQGIGYALDRIKSVAGGLTGRQAVNAIVSRFERPADPGREIAGALAAYGANGVQPRTPLTPQAPGAAGAASTGGPSPIAQALQLLGFQAPQGFGAAQAAPRAPMSVRPAQTPVQINDGSLVPGQIEGATAGEQGRFLQALRQLAGYEHAPVRINSGYRSYADQARLYANRASNPNPVAAPGHSLHERGLAADGTVNGIPLGLLPAAVLARFGLAKVPGDPVHVQIAR